ncbi:hypothetical protein [Nocardiopsis kunsanensis]|uniref:Uncharacterized protein n=1 Tax=Nocardiopsis kunsanensis TaxID=141693 RepID=A0A918X8L9_9ACTN|nr:hypothetical protein [Nocardiopsis kunsanensis]GHD18478.1 hypothetical protein GCM10007147_08720 [Nocardiopsis kunsanensis]
MAAGVLTVMLARGLENADRRIVEDGLDGRLSKREAAQAEEELLERARRFSPLPAAVMAALLGATVWEAVASGDWGGWTPFHLLFFCALFLVVLVGRVQVGARLADARERAARLRS